MRWERGHHAASERRKIKHAVFLDGHEVERRGELVFEAPSRVSTSEVAEVLQRTRDKMFAYLRRRGMLALGDEDDANEMAPRPPQSQARRPRLARSGAAASYR